MVIISAFNSAVKKSLKNTCFPADSQILDYVASKGLKKDDFYSRFDELLHHWNAVFYITEVINPKHRLKYYAAVGYKDGETKEKYFTRYDAASRWLGEKTLDFVRREFLKQEKKR